MIARYVFVSDPRGSPLLVLNPSSATIWHFDVTDPPICADQSGEGRPKRLHVQLRAPGAS